MQISRTTRTTSLPSNKTFVNAVRVAIGHVPEQVRVVATVLGARRVLKAVDILRGDKVDTRDATTINKAEVRQADSDVRVGAMMSKGAIKSVRAELHREAEPATDKAGHVPAEVAIAPAEQAIDQREQAIDQQGAAIVLAIVQQVVVIVLVIAQPEAAIALAGPAIDQQAAAIVPAGQAIVREDQATEADTVRIKGSSSRAIRLVHHEAVTVRVATPVAHHDGFKTISRESSIRLREGTIRTTTSAADVVDS